MSPHPGFAVIDLETTGFGGSDRIIEVGVVLLDQQLRQQGTWETLVQPNRNVATSHVHKLTATHLKNAPTWEEVAPHLAKVLRGRIGVAHNASFEKRFLSKEFRRVGIATNVGDAHWVDTKELATAQLGYSRLADALEAAGLTNTIQHAALPDAIATAELLRTLSGTLMGVPLLFDGAAAPTPANLVTRQELGVESAARVSTSTAPAKPADSADSDKNPESDETAGTGGSTITTVSTGVAATAESGDSAAADEWLARLAQTLPTGGNGGPDQYRELLLVSLADRDLTPAQFYGLTRFAHDTGLTDEDVAEIHEDFIRQIAVEAWLDGVITDREKTELSTLAEQLSVDPVLVEELLTEPQTGDGESRIELSSGDRIAFTGAMDLPRETWEARARTRGLDIGEVAENTVVVVSANPDSTSGKARRARELNIPIVSETHFAQLLAGMDLNGADDQPELPEDASGASSRFTWVPSVMPGAHESELQNQEIAALWIQHFPTEQLMELSTVLSAETTIDLAGSSAARVGSLWAERHQPMLSATVEDLRDLPGVGAKRLERLVEAVVLAAIDADLPQEADAEKQDGQNGDVFRDSDYADDAYADDPLAFADPYSTADSETEKELDVLAGWLTLTETELPDGVKGLVPGVDKRMAEDVLAGLFARCVDELVATCSDDTRKLTIVSMRYMGGATLEELGTHFNVSRERIRQLEREIRRNFDVPNALSTDVAQELAEKFLPLSTFAEVNEDIPALAMTAEPFEGTYERYFRMWGLWKTDETWITAPGFAEAVDAALAEHSNEYNAVLIGAAAADLGADSHLLAEWMSQRTGLLVLPDGEHVLIARSHQDRAAGVLSIKGEPMTLSEIVQATGMNINERSVSNAMSVDERIIRVASNLYGLREWGMEEFFTITDWITSRIQASPTGSVALKDLLEEAPSLSVSENSVRAYVGGADFVLDDGHVTLPDTDTAGDSAGSPGEPTEADPQDYRDLYWRDDAWHMLLTVNQDHLRGSGFSVPRGVAGIYRVPVGDKVAVPSRLGEQFVRVNALKQSTTSTIRRFLMEAEAAEGDRVWLRFAPDEFTVVPAPARAFEVDDQEVDLAHLLDSMALDHALANDSDTALVAINEALGLDTSAPRRRTVAIFRHRGQDEYADLIRDL